MYNWKINMKNGNVHIIKTKYNELKDIVKEIFGETPIALSSWNLAYEKNYNNFGKSDSVLIISTDVSSIEYYCGNN